MMQELTILKELGLTGAYLSAAAWVSVQTWKVLITTRNGTKGGNGNGHATVRWQESVSAEIKYLGQAMRDGTEQMGRMAVTQTEELRRLDRSMTRLNTVLDSMQKTLDRINA